MMSMDDRTEYHRETQKKKQIKIKKDKERKKEEGGGNREEGKEEVKENKNLKKETKNNFRGQIMKGKLFSNFN